MRLPQILQQAPAAQARGPAAGSSQRGPAARPARCAPAARRARAGPAAAVLRNGRAAPARRRGPAACLALALAVAALAAVPAAAAGPASAGTTAGAAGTSPAAVNVTVNAEEGLGTIPSTAYGLNSAVWDSQMNVPAGPGPAAAGRRAGCCATRAAPTVTSYNWQNNTVPGGYVAPGTDFDSVHGHGEEDRRAAHPHRQLRHGHAAGGGGLGPVRQRHQGLRRQVLGDRQRDLRQRLLRQRTGRPTTTPARARRTYATERASSTRAR